MSVSGKLLSSTPRLVYLEGPTAEEDDDNAITWRSFLGLRLAQVGIATYNPYLAYRSPHRAGDQVQRINQAAIGCCDAMVVNLIGNPITFGVGRDIGYARANNKPVIVVHNLGDDLVQLDELDLHDCEIVPTLEAALELLVLPATALPRSLLVTTIRARQVPTPAT